LRRGIVLRLTWFILWVIWFIFADEFSCSGEHLMQNHPGDISGAEEKTVSAQIEAPILHKVNTAQKEEPSEH
jgi:hypothetical protein